MIRVGIIRGGTNSHYDASLASGAYILKNLSRDRFEPVDIFIDTEGVWHVGGKPVSHDKLRQCIDVAWNTLQGFYGADGKVQQLLESLGIPYVGSGPFSSALTMHKKLCKDHLADLGIKTPRGIFIESWGEEDREETVSTVVKSIARDFSPPWLVEPISRGQGKEPIRVKTRDELMAVLFEMFDLSIPVMIEEEVFGTPVSVIAISGFRGKDVYTFLPAGVSGGRDTSIRDAVQATACKVHSGLSLGHFSCVKAVVTPKGQVCVTSIDTVPSFAPNSEIHSALESVGSSFNELSTHCLFSTLPMRRY